MYPIMVEPASVCNSPKRKPRVPLSQARVAPSCSVTWQRSINLFTFPLAMLPSTSSTLKVFPPWAMMTPK